MLDFMKETKSSWEKIKESGLPVVVYGMGNGADKVIDEFNRLNIEIKGVTASDDFVRGQQFRGFTVKKLSEFDGEFIIAVAFATCIPEVMNHILSISRKHRVLVPCVPVFGDDIFNREFIKKHKYEINTAYSLFDNESQKIFAGCVDFMFGGNPEILFDITSDKNEIFLNIMKLSNDEDYLDLGAYRGDTIKEFLNYTNGNYSSITALEPDRKTFRKLCDYAQDMHDTILLQKAVYSSSDTVHFNSAAGRQSSISDKGESTEAVSIDDLFASKTVSYIKMDVEGAEYEALLGGKVTLRTQKPKLNIALYHRSEDIFRLPLLINEINANYRFFIRRHPYIPCWDMNLYCI